MANNSSVAFHFCSVYLNEATECVFFMSFGRSFQARIVDGKRELENKCALCNSEYLQHSEGYMYKGGTMSERYLGQ